METLSQPRRLDLPLLREGGFWRQLHGCESGNLVQTHRELWAGEGSPCKGPATSKGTGLPEGMKPAMVSTVPYQLASPPSLQTDHKRCAVNEVHSSARGSAGRCLPVKQPEIRDLDSRDLVAQKSLLVCLPQPARCLNG